MGKLLGTEIEVDWLNYPKEFRRIVDLQLCDLDPWFILKGEQLEIRYLGMRKRYPDQYLVPFARRADNDDVACFEKDIAGKVVIIHDFASLGYEQKKIHDHFWDWFRDAVEEMIFFTD